MELCRKGIYTKYLRYNNEKDILTFIASNGEDNYFKVLNLLREKGLKTNGYQCCSDKEENRNFETIAHVFYNVYGQPKKVKLLHFDFLNNRVITENGKVYKIKECNEFVYKIQKTQIRAINGIKGLYQHIIETLDVNSPFNGSFHGILEKIDN